MKIILVNCSLRIEFESNICSKSYLFIGNSYIYTTDFKQIIIIEAKYFQEFFLDSLRSKKSPQQQILMYMPWIRSYDIHYMLFLLVVDNIQLLHKGFTSNPWGSFRIYNSCKFMEENYRSP